MKNKRPLTEDQQWAMEKMARGHAGTAAISRRIGRQLEQRGLAHYTGHDYERVEWQRVVARLPVYQLTAAGRELMEVS